VHKNGDVMKKMRLIGLILIFGASTLIGCASSEYIPQGATKIGTLEGSFFGTRFKGSCKINLFELQDGTRRFEGNFSSEMLAVVVFLEGTVSGNQLNGQMRAPADGNLTGSLSPDGSQINGSYTMTSPGTDNGTWQATGK
jgi:hypothetical protein